MKIGLFTDAHYCSKEKTCENRRPTLSYGKIKEAMEAFSECDAVICLGDIVDDCGNKEENITKIKEITKLIKSYNIPFYCMMGNHDYHNFTREEFIEYTDNSYPPFSVTFGDSTFVFLDANYEDNGNIYEPGKVDWANSFIPKDQLDKLKLVLDDDSSKNIYILTHQNLETEVQWQHIIRNAEEIRNILKNSKKIKKVIQGHYHPGHDMTIDGIEYHTLPAMCEGEENYFEIMEL